MNKPLVTYGITAFNAADTIERAVNSALGQTWEHHEVVIVDDASSDATPDILRSLAYRHPRIRLITLDQNGGVAAARNCIVKAARGEFIAFFDDDDISRPDRIVKQVERLVTYEKSHARGAPVICHTARAVVYPDGTRRVESTMGQRFACAAPSGLPVVRRVLIGSPLKDGYGSCSTCSQLARTSTYRNLGGFDPELRRGEDTDFNVRLALSGGHFVGLRETLVVQTMTKTAEKSLQDEYAHLLKILRKHQSVLEAEGLYEFAIKWSAMRQAWFAKSRATFIWHALKLIVQHPYVTTARAVAAFSTIGTNLAFRRFHASTSYAQEK